jgi:hypothetical protein
LLAQASCLLPYVRKHDFGRSLFAAVWRVLVQPCCALGRVWCDVREPKEQHQRHSIVRCISLFELALLAASHVVLHVY